MSFHSTNITEKKRFIVILINDLSKFILFINHKNELPKSYIKFLINKIRNDFDFLGVPLRIEIKSNLPEPINIASIDFDALAEMVAKIDKPKTSDAERLKNIIDRKLKPLLLKNKARQDLQHKFEELVEQYNLGAYTAEEFFNQLSDFVKDLGHEENRLDG